MNFRQVTASVALLILCSACSAYDYALAGRMKTYGEDQRAEAIKWVAELPESHPCRDSWLEAAGRAEMLAGAARSAQKEQDEGEMSEAAQILWTATLLDRSRDVTDAGGRALMCVAVTNDAKRLREAAQEAAEEAERQRRRQ